MCTHAAHLQLDRPGRPAQLGSGRAVAELHKACEEVHDGLDCKRCFPAEICLRQSTCQSFLLRTKTCWQVLQHQSDNGRVHCVLACMIMQLNVSS